MDKNKYLVLSALAASSLVLWKYISPQPNHSDEPSLVSGSLPIVGHYFQLTKNPRKFIREAREKYGPCFRVKLPAQGTLVVVTGELIPEVMKNTKSFSFAKGIERLIPSKDVVSLSYDHKHIAEEISPRSKNPIIYPIKHNFKEHQIDIFSDRIQSGLKRGFRNKLDIAVGERREVKLLETISYVVANISGPCFASRAVENDEDFIQGIAMFTSKVIRASMTLIALPMWLGKIVLRRFFSVEKEMDLIMTRLVPMLQKVRNGVEIEPSYATMALSLPKEDGNLRSVEDVAYYFKDIAFASIHTTSHFASLALHELSTRPELMQDLIDEINTLDTKTPETVAALPLMDSFLREILRSYGDFMGLNHLAMKDTVLSTGQVIREGSTIVLAIDDAQHDPAHFPSPDLETFNPRRFMNSSLKSSTIGLDLLVFGIGSHACPGRYFAVNEIKYIIGEIITKYNLEPKSGSHTKEKIVFGMYRFPTQEPLVFSLKDQ
ncbi:cytochrome P450 [Sporodiniella umbellata]|nr:cytochrome P450 [Sporodiniella umbellata]